MDGLNEVPAILSSIQNHWQFMGLCIIALVVVLYLYWKYLKKESDALLSKARELEEARTLIRKQDRDKQIATLESYFKAELNSANKRIDVTDTKVDGIGRSFDRHCEESTKKFERVDVTYDRIDVRLKNLEENSIKDTEFKELQRSVHKIESQVASIETGMKYMADINSRMVSELKEFRVGFGEGKARAYNYGDTA